MSKAAFLVEGGGLSRFENCEEKSVCGIVQYLAFVFIFNFAVNVAEWTLPSY